MEITASMVKELRERSGAGMMECKKALSENAGNIDTAIEWLRKQGLAKADKKASRVAAEGRIVLAQGQNGSAGQNLHSGGKPGNRFLGQGGKLLQIGGGSC